MSFGKKEKAKTIAAPKSQTPEMFTPFGTVGANKNDITYTPNYLLGQKEALNTSSSKFNDVLGGMNTSTDINQAFNNPFYDTISQLMMGDINRNADQQRKTLAKQLAARGSLHNSSGIYAQALQGRDIASTTNDALLKARLGAYDSYRQNEQDNMARGQFFQSATTNGINQVLEPLRMYSSVSAPMLQTNQANMSAQLQTNNLNAALAQQKQQQQAQQQEQLQAALMVAAGAASANPYLVAQGAGTYASSGGGP